MKTCSSAYNEGAQNLERYIDRAPHKELFDDIYFDDLESVFNEIDTFETAQQEKINELEDNILDLQEEIKLLKEKLQKYE